MKRLQIGERKGETLLLAEIRGTLLNGLFSARRTHKDGACLQLARFHRWLPWSFHVPSTPPKRPYPISTHPNSPSSLLAPSFVWGCSSRKKVMGYWFKVHFC